ncbi:MAG: dihydropteroate synthase [Candidatus Peribacteraceae bacterium]|nr:dihydropteroate synthase [Candidatus Peribacteraceae bacterium]MBP9850279.1 dihydropteroate synthase [Candidatus Peribacteraceae bacterium]
MDLRSKQRVLRLKDKTGVVGVINVTPDSYVLGSRAQNQEEIVALAQECIDGGADILEIGGESTGPASHDVSVAEELARVVPAVTLLRKKFPDTWISVDTWKSEVAHASLAAGADMINDVTAGRGDEGMFAILAAATCPVILMYAKDSSARTTSSDVRYDDVVTTIYAFLKMRIHEAKKAGVGQIIVDPGLGHFVSSDPAYSWEILARLSEFTDLGPILVSPSRKSFLAGPSALPVAERLPATLAASCLAAMRGASFIRTHDVRQTRQALQSIAGIL